MQALINNYSFVSGSSLSVSSFKSYCTAERWQTSASVVMTEPGEVNLNTKIIYLLNEYLNLEDDWDNDGAKVPSPRAINNAFSLTDILSKHAQPIFHVAPGPRGEIMLDIRNKSKTSSVEIIFYHDKAISVFFPSQGNPVQQEFTFDNLPDLLKDLNKKMI